MSGLGDLRMVAKGAKKMGFLTIGALFEAYIEIKILLNNNDGQRREKKRRKKRGNEEQKERTGDNSREEEQAGEDQQEQARPPRHQRGRVVEVPDPHRLNTHDARLTQIKNSKETWPFSSVVGCEDGKGIERRNLRVNGAGANPPE